VRERRNEFVGLQLEDKDMKETRNEFQEKKKSKKYYFKG
jgi:hypothetical protein